MRVGKALLGLMSVLFIGICVWLTSSGANATPLQPMRFNLEKSEKVVIRGYRGSVNYTVNENLEDISIQVIEGTTGPTEKLTKPVERTLASEEEWQVSMNKENDQVLINIEGPITKQRWSEILASQNFPYYSINITGPSRPVEVNWQQGQVSLNNLNSQVQVTLLKGDVVVEGGSGDANISNQEGVIRLKNRKGQMRIDAYLAKVEIEGIEGKLELENFTGDSVVQNVSGQVDLASYRGTTRMASVNGRIDFKNGNSALHIEKFEGELRGKSAQGAIFAEVNGDANIRVESAEGAVNLRLPASSAWVNLGTEEGNIAAPSFLKLTRVSDKKYRTGKLRGGASGGSVFVRTTTGDIRIR